MSHVTTSTTHPSSDTESLSDFDVLGGDPEHISIPGPSASKGELLETLKALQVQMQRLQAENRSIKEENKTLHADKPKRKRRADTQHEFSVHEDTITIYARKHGMMVEMFPSSELLNKKRPASPTAFDSSERYVTAATEETAFLDELYRHFPELLHKVMESSFFSDLVLKSIPDARANEIKKLRGVAGDIFGLPAKYFTNPQYDRASVPEIRQLLGVTSTSNVVYKTFPPVLFPKLIEDKSLKTVFGNWELLARILKASLHGVASLHQESSGGGAHTNSLKWSVHQITPGSIAWAAVIVIFLLSPDTEFSNSSTGKKSNICYRNLFHLYKKVLVTKWATKRIATIVTNINHYIFKPSILPNKMITQMQSIARLQRLKWTSLSALTEPDATTSTNAGDSELRDPHVSDPDILGGENTQDVEGSISNSARGRGKMRAKKAAASGGAVRRGRSRK
ncbi:hypothetical protein F4604DRAFT_1922928 [Suillus subluteus]|nr:hypothetical protein F4604DRAFT_1922928 [Suillus subluteus]